MRQNDASNVGERIDTQNRNASLFFVSWLSEQAARPTRSAYPTRQRSSLTVLLWPLRFLRRSTSCNPRIAALPISGSFLSSLIIFFRSSPLRQRMLYETTLISLRRLMFAFALSSPLPTSSRGHVRCAGTTKKARPGILLPSRSSTCDSRSPTQTVFCFDRFAGPQRSSFRCEVDVVPLRIKMGQHQFFRRTLVRQTHRIRELEVFLNRFVSPERTFHQQQSSVVLRTVPNLPKNRCQKYRQTVSSLRLSNPAPNFLPCVAS